MGRRVISEDTLEKVGIGFMDGGKRKRCNDHSCVERTLIAETSCKFIDTMTLENILLYEGNWCLLVEIIVSSSIAGLSSETSCQKQ
jgi:hypothetical protein